MDAVADSLARHPGLRTGEGITRLRTATTPDLPDEEFRDLLRAALVF